MESQMQVPENANICVKKYITWEECPLPVVIQVNQSHKYFEKVLTQSSVITLHLKKMHLYRIDDTKDYWRCVIQKKYEPYS